MHVPKYAALRHASPARHARRAAAAGALLLTALLAATGPARAATRGPSTQEERDKVVKLAASLEAQPWSEDAAASRQWILTFLSEAPDITVKRCLSLFGAAADRASIRPELLEQQMYSGAAYNFQHPDENPGSTGTFVAGLTGALNAYTAWRAHGGIDAIPLLDELVRTQKAGELERYVRERGRNCR
jgi:hypothetical protein